LRTKIERLNLINKYFPKKVSKAGIAVISQQMTTFPQKIPTLWDCVTQITALPLHPNLNIQSRNENYT
jgi:hypothetical protein